MKRLMWAAALAVAVPVLAQGGPDEVRMFTRPLPPGPGGPHGDHVMILGAEEGFELKTVKGAPYQAEAVTEVVQTLADGNRISRKTTSTVARDGEGRVRRETPMAALGPLAPGDGPKLVFIHDPVAKTGYALEMDEKVARKLSPPPHFERHAPPGPEPQAGVREMRKLRKKVKDFPKGKKEDLGSQTIEGVTAKGSRSTHTIAAGEIGNERPIQVVDERWFSDELQTVVMSRHVDPRMGETMYRLTSIQKGEPDASLFQVPEGFKVEEGGPFHKRIKIKDK